MKPKAEPRKGAPVPNQDFLNQRETTTILTPRRNRTSFHIRERDRSKLSRMSEETDGRYSAIRSGLSRENLGIRLRAIGKTLRNIPRPTILNYTILTLILTLAGIVRLLPLPWGAYISEFDPYFNFNDMRQITANGWQAWYS